MKNSKIKKKMMGLRLIEEMPFRKGNMERNKDFEEILKHVWEDSVLHSRPKAYQTLADGSVCLVLELSLHIPEHLSWEGFGAVHVPGPEQNKRFYSQSENDEELADDDFAELEEDYWRHIFRECS